MALSLITFLVLITTLDIMKCFLNKSHATRRPHMLFAYPYKKSCLCGVFATADKTAMHAHKKPTFYGYS